MQTYNDGVLNVYRVENVAEPGNIPEEKLTLKVKGLRFQELRVFDSKYWSAFQVNAMVERLLRVQNLNNIFLRDIVEVEGRRFRVIQIQKVIDVLPKSIDLTLERIEVPV